MPARPVPSRSAVLAGVKTTVPLVVPVIPFGLVLGLAINETDAVSRLAGFASAPLVMGGASQLAGVSLLAAGASMVTIVSTIAVINARHVMYSARLRSRFRHLPLWFRIVAPYVLLDQAFAVTDRRFGAVDADRSEDGSVDRSTDRSTEAAAIDDGELMGFYLGSGGLLAGVWIVTLGIGVLVGDALPSSWSLDATVPLLFIGLLVLAVDNRPGVAAAVAGGVVAVIGRSFPSGSGLLAGAVVGVVVGGVVDHYLLRRGRAGDDGVAVEAGR